MGRGRYNRAKNTGGNKPPRRPLALHPLFGFVLGLWGAALGGLVTLVLPRDFVLGAAARAGLAGTGANAPFVLAVIAALVLGGALLAIAGLITRAATRTRRRQDTPSLAMMAVRHVQTIDPASELGSRSLDDPIEAMPFASLKPEFETEAQAAGEAASPPPPVELDLAEFGALPGRNAVWVEESGFLGVNAPEAVAPPVAEPVMAEAPPADQPAHDPVLQAVSPAPRPPGPSAIEHLRAVPTSELSLVQMVERFAAALHEHQTVPQSRGHHRSAQPGREAALAEALKALAAFSPDQSSSAQGEPLRAALTRLQELRGAA